MNNPNDPNNPFEQQPYQPQQQPGPGGYQPSADDTPLDAGGPSVAASPAKMMVAVVGLIAVGGFVLYQIFSSDEKPIPKATPMQVVEAPTPEPPPAPPPPPPPPPPPAPPPAPPPPPPAPTEIQDISEKDKQAEARRQTRLRSNMLVMNGEGAGSGIKNALNGSTDQNFSGNDRNNEFARNLIKASPAEKEVATSIGKNLNQIVGQGKIIEATLESAINTDLPGPIRGIVSRDLYAESGRDVMIPKGSRLIGTYNTGLLRGQERVFIIWTRVIRPDGVDVAINSPGIDMLGRSGVAGEVDNKYLQMFSAAILTSTLNIGVAAIGEAISGDEATTTTRNTDGSITSTGTSMSQATQNSIDQIGAVGKSVVTDFMDLRPTIWIDQGTRVNVFVNHDIIFPKSTVGNARFIQ